MKRKNRRKQPSYINRIFGLSAKYGIKFEVCLAIGDDESLYPKLKLALHNLGSTQITVIRDLRSNHIDRMRYALMHILGDDLYNDLTIRSMKHIEVMMLSHYVADKCEEALKKLG